MTEDYAYQIIFALEDLIEVVSMPQHYRDPSTVKQMVLAELADLLKEL
jgi:hypothetical protein